MNRLIISAIFSAACLIIAGCGGGGGGGAAVPVAASAKAKTTLKTSGLVTGTTVVTSLDIEISIPYGVTAEIDPLTKEPAKSIITLIGPTTINAINDLNVLKYTAATPTSNGLLRIVYLNPDGFSTADSLLIQLDITNGFFPKTSDFSLVKFDITTMSADGSDKTSPTPVPNPVFTATVI